MAPPTPDSPPPARPPILGGGVCQALRQPSFAFPPHGFAPPRSRRLTGRDPRHDPPLLLHNDSNVELWWRPDRVFLRPRMDVRCRLWASFAADRSAAAAAHANMLLDVAADALRETAYSAGLAGYSYNAEHSSEGLDFTWSGWSDEHVMARGSVCCMRWCVCIGGDGTPVASRRPCLFFFSPTRLCRFALCRPRLVPTSRGGLHAGRIHGRWAGRVVRPPSAR